MLARSPTRPCALPIGSVARSFGGVHSHHRFVNCPGSRPNFLIASALNGQIALALSSGARTRDTSCAAFVGSGSATTNGAYSGSPSPSRRVVTITSCPAVDSNAAMKANMHPWPLLTSRFGCLIHNRTLRHRNRAIFCTPTGSRNEAGQWNHDCASWKSGRGAGARICCLFRRNHRKDPRCPSPSRPAQQILAGRPNALARRSFRVHL